MVKIFVIMEYEGTMSMRRHYQYIVYLKNLHFYICFVLSSKALFPLNRMVSNLDIDLLHTCFCLV